MADALRRLDQTVPPLDLASELVSLDQAQGRILAHSLVASAPVPPFANAAVDGWAFAHASLLQEDGTLRARAGKAAAGHPFAEAVGAGEAVRVLTGAPLPQGTDTVALDEDSVLDGSTVRLIEALKPRANTRPEGEDLRPGQRLFDAGHRLRAPDLGLVAQLGLGEVAVRQRLRVALASTGDELRPAGEALPPGAIVDANRPILKPMLHRLGMAVSDLGILSDDRDAVRATLTEAARTHDAIITSGGASRSEEDHVMAVLNELGELAFWRIAIKPGRPLGLGRIGDAVVVALPGNPVAATVCFLRFARPLLLKRAGAGFDHPLALPIPAAFSFQKPAQRTEFLRGRLVTDGAGSPQVDRIAREGSGRLTSLGEADGLIELEAERTRVEPGEPVAWLPFSAFGCV